MPAGTAAKVLQALQNFDLKQDGDGQYRSNSPLRPGSNSHGFTLTIDDDEHGAYFDHVSGDTGSLYDLAKQLNITIEGVPVENTKRAYTGLEDYAAAHGIAPGVLRRAGWFETIRQKRPALEFPTKTGKRWRFLDGNKPHYKSESGYQRSWYGFSASTLKLLGEGQPLVLCNGEISTLAAQQHGIAAACITGGEKSIPADLMQELKTLLGDDPPDIIVAMDCDPTGRDAARLITKQLHRETLFARAVDLGLGTGGDLADFCMLYLDKSAAELESLPVLTLEATDTAPQQRRGWYIIPAAELKNLPPIEWIVPGEIPARGITILFGPSGAGKSFLALDYALKIAQEQPVLYMAGEGEYGYRQRVAAWCKHNQKAEGKLMMCIGAVQLMESDDLDAFLQANRSIQPLIVIVDTMARSMVGSDENSTRDMGMFIQACEDIKRTLDCAVLVIHHTNKGGIYERGNSALRGASDSMIKITADDDLIVIESAKTKDAQPFPTRYMKLLSMSFEIDNELIESAVMVEADKVIQTPDDPLTPNQEKVLRMLADEEHGATRNEISEATSVPYHSLQRILVRLRKLEFVEQESRTSPFKITESGRQRLGVDRLDRVDRPILQSAENADTDQHRSNRSTRSMRGKVDRVDRSDHRKNGDTGPKNGDHGDPGAQLIDQQPLFGSAGSEYHKAGL